MEIRLLGPVELRSREGVVALGSDKERFVLAHLALEANRPVSAAVLLAHGWMDVDPTDAGSRLQTPVSRLRNHLRDAAAPGSAAPRVDSGSRAYTLKIEPEVVDLHRFRYLVRRGRELARTGDDVAAHRVLTEAVPLWRGDPLLGLTGAWPDAVRRSLAPMRRSADAARIGAGLRLHRYAEAADELLDLVERHPDDETFVVQLMLALAGTGQVSEATTVHRDACQRLVTGFGLNPGPVLRHVHEGLLAGTSADQLVAATAGGVGTSAGADGHPRRGTDTGAGAGARTGTGAPTRTDTRTGDSPRTARPSGQQPARSSNPTHTPGTSDGTPVPTDTDDAASTTPTTSPAIPTSTTSPGSRAGGADGPAPWALGGLPRQGPLVGRRSELAALTERAIVATTGQRPDPVTLVCVTGMPGVGKSALAVAAARELADHFPTVVFLKLNAHTESGPISEGTALSRLLVLTGFPEDDVPRDVVARGALWRARLAGMRCLLVLDDAGSPDHVRPLLPGDSSPSFTIVTSRRRLTGLPSAAHLTLDVLPVADAVDLFQLLAGPERTADRSTVERVVSLAGHIALGVELLASRFATRPTWRLGDLAERLSRLPEKLGEIRDMHNELGRAFELSYLSLTDEQRRGFRRLGLHPGHDFTVQDAQALLGAAQSDTERVLEALLACHLVAEPQPDRYLAHSLLREYATLLAYQEEPAAERRAAVTRLVRYYADATDRAVRIALPHRTRLTRPVDDEQVRPPRWRSAREARAWLAVERQNLGAAERMARTSGQPETAASLGHLLAVYLDSESRWSEAEVLHLRSIAHWGRAGDRAALRQALILLAQNRSDNSKYPTALEACELALDAARTDGDAETEAAAFGVAGVVRWRMGDVSLAVDHQRHALTMRTMVGTDLDRARVNNNLAIALAESIEAEAHFEEALRGFQAAGDTRAEITVLANLGNLHGRRGSLETARTFFEAALPRIETDGSLYQLATTRSNLAEVLGRCEEFDRALALHHEAIDAFRQVHDRLGLANALNSLAETLSRAGQYDEAVLELQTALRTAEEIDARPEAIEALRDLGCVELSRGDSDTAEGYLFRAVSLAEDANAPREIALSRAALAEVLLSRESFTEAIRQLTDAVRLMREADPYATRHMEARLAELRGTSRGERG